jgi:hypothetical protein
MSKQIDEAAKELAYLYVFSAVVGALENGTISGSASKDAERIIKIAKTSQQRCLARYEALSAKIKANQ